MYSREVKKSGSAIELATDMPELALRSNPFGHGAGIIISSRPRNGSSFQDATDEMKNLERLVKDGQSSTFDVKLADIIKSMLKDIEELEEKRKGISEDSSPLAALCDEAIEKISKYKELLSPVHLEAEKTKHIFSKIENVRTSLSSILIKLQKRHFDLETEVKDLKTQLEENSKRVNELVTNVEKLTSDNESLKTKLTLVSEKVEALEKHTQKTDIGFAKLVLRQLLTEVQTRMYWEVFPEQMEYPEQAIYFSDLVRDVDELDDTQLYDQKKNLLQTLKGKYQFDERTESHIKRLIRGSFLNGEAHPTLESVDFIETSLTLLRNRKCIKETDYHFCKKLLQTWSALKASNELHS